MLVLMTGATGFLGSHLARGLVKDGHTIMILKRSSSDCRRIADILPSVYAYDLDREEGRIPFEKHRNIDAIIHTATCYGRQGESFAELVAANVTFPLQLLEMAIRHRIPLFLNTDTFSSAPAALSAHLTGYNLTKKQFLEWGRLLAASSSIRFRNMRLEHVYGPFDGNNKFVPFVIQKCLAHEKELALTLGEQKRDFVYVEDVVDAYRTVLMRAIEQPDSFAEYEVGTGVATSIRELVSLVHDLAASRTVLKFGALPYAEDEIMLSRANTRPLQELGWSSQVSLAEGIQKTINEGTNRRKQMD